jgi:hypothetical protein
MHDPGGWMWVWIVRFRFHAHSNHLTATSICPRPHGLYALCRKKFRRKQFFTSEDAAKVRVRGKSSFGKIFFGEEEHNRPHPPSIRKKETGKNPTPTLYSKERNWEKPSNALKPFSYSLIRRHVINFVPFFTC